MENNKKKLVLSTFTFSRRLAGVAILAYQQAQQASRPRAGQQAAASHADGWDGPLAGAVRVHARRVSTRDVYRYRCTCTTLSGVNLSQDLGSCHCSESDRPVFWLRRPVILILGFGDLSCEGFGREFSVPVKWTLKWHWLNSAVLCCYSMALRAICDPRPFFTSTW